MADKIVKIYGDARFLPRHDTLENWQTKNPILLEAEPSYVIDGEDGKKIKFGDGVTPWNDLPYLSSSINNGGDITVDQTYNPTSENAQSGKAVAEAISEALMGYDYNFSEIKGLNVIRVEKGEDGTHTSILKYISALNADERILIFDNEIVIVVSDSIEYLKSIGFEADSTYQIKISNGELEHIGKLTKGAPTIVDQTYTPTSPNAQSGIAVAEALSGYVMAEVGKGLSTNDFTDDDKKQVDNSIKIAGISNGELSFEMNAGVYNIKAFTKITFRTYASSSDGMTTMEPTKLGSTSTDTFLFVSFINTTPSYQIKEFRLSGGNRETVYRITRATNATTGEYTDTLTDETPKVDQTYIPTSPNAQSGLATAEAVGVANDYTDKAIKSSKTYANNNFAPAIKNTVSSSVLAVHDVSPIEHSLDIKLLSDTVTDFSTVSVSRYGENLWDFYNLTGITDGYTVTKNGLTATIKDGYITIAGTHTYSGYTNIIDLGFKSPYVKLPSGTYSLPTSQSASQAQIFCSTSAGNKFNTFTMNALFVMYGFYVACSGEGTIVNDKIPLTFISGPIRPTDYKPYIQPQTVTANADGTVEGLTSISPNMTVTTDTQGVVIDMTYNADTKMYIDNKLAEISTAIVNNV